MEKWKNGRRHVYFWYPCDESGSTITATMSRFMCTCKSRPDRESEVLFVYLFPKRDMFHRTKMIASKPRAHEIRTLPAMVPLSLHTEDQLKRVRCAGTEKSVSFENSGGEEGDLAIPRTEQSFWRRGGSKVRTFISKNGAGRKLKRRTRSSAASEIAGRI